ncbi:tonB-system energizer ExbB [Aminobacter sp. AP02]|uniref:tonB-system energizer ExbB n=1 Tax=Aminobacter sp. AP02 TaxID=2135737 RepID=UPI001FDF148D|nr:tonB-system energizer ExbB [Aminobacter sp. AP02]
MVGLVLCLALNAGAALAQQSAPANAEAPVAAPGQNVDSQPAVVPGSEATQPRIQAEPSGPDAAPAAVNDTSAAPFPVGNAGPEAPAVEGSGNAGSAAPVDTTVAPAPDLPASTLPHDLSPWGMFMAADWVVKAVMIGLAIASLVTWTVWLAKSLEIAASKARLKKALRGILHARRLDDAAQALGDKAGIGNVLVRAAVEEMEMSGHEFGHGDASGIKERVESRLVRIQAQAGRRLSRGTGVLATIGSTAPFVGLFGTVWGIMNSFIGISESQTTNLAVVAPGIAEALLATAVGLIAAIPAVVIYNVFARSITSYRQGLGDAAAGVQRLVSRDLDRQTSRSERPHPAHEAVRANGRLAPAAAV